MLRKEGRRNDDLQPRLSGRSVPLECAGAAECRRAHCPQAEPRSSDRGMEHVGIGARTIPAHTTKDARKRRGASDTS